MDINYIVGIIILAAFVVPVALYTIRQNNKKKALESCLSGIGKDYDIRIFDHQSWGNKIIGLDTAARKAVLITRENQGENLVELVDLSQISKCMVEKSTVASENGGSVDAVREVRIRFVPREKTKKDQLFVIFNDEGGQDLGPELGIATEWTDKFSRLV